MNLITKRKTILMFVWCLIFMALQHVTALSRVIIPDGTRAVFQNYLGTEVGMERSKNTIQTYEDDVNSRNQADAIFMPHALIGSI